jgi:acylpyruvate hydrolase
MHLVTYQHEGQARTGVLQGESVVDLNRAYRAALRHLDTASELAVADLRLPIDMVSLLAGGEDSLKAAGRAVAFAQEHRLETGDTMLAAQGILYAIDHVTLLAPVLRPGKIVCLGFNYRDHAAESALAVPEYPVLFHKVSGSLVGQGQPIVIPRLSDKIDYEGELAVIIGKRGKDITENNALSFVAGYAAANDVSARDLQFRTSQWTSGKMLDTFAPLGPALVTRDEVPDPNKLRIKTIVNGEVMQDASTADMIFHVPFIISYISQITTLEPGDVILTGTPSGVGQSRDPQVFLQAGDCVSIEIERLGVLSNPLVAEG